MEALLRVGIRTFAVKESLVLCAAAFREVLGGSDEDRGSGDGDISRLRVLVSHSSFSVSDHNCRYNERRRKISFTVVSFCNMYISPAGCNTNNPTHTLLKAFSVLFAQTDRQTEMGKAMGLSLGTKCLALLLE